MLSRQFDFDGPTLALAVARTFAHRGTAMEFPPVALTAQFAADPIKRIQWRGFLAKSKLTGSQDLAEVLRAITVFLNWSPWRCRPGGTWRNGRPRGRGRAKTTTLFGETKPRITQNVRKNTK